MSPIVGFTPFVYSMASPRVQPVGTLSVSEVMQAVRISHNYTVIVDMQQSDKEPTSVALSWLKGVSQTRGVSIHVLWKGSSLTIRPKALPLPDIEIPQHLARSLVEDILRMQRDDPTGKAIVEAYGEAATDALCFLMDRFSETTPSLNPDEEVPTDLARPLLESVFKLLQHDLSGRRVADTYGGRALGAIHFLMDRLPDLSAAAVRASGHIGGSEARSMSARHLRHENPVIRAIAAEALGRMRAMDASEDLWPLIIDDKEYLRVRRSAAMSLGLIGAWDMTPRLADLLEAENHFTRLIAACALGWYSIPMSFLDPKSERDKRYLAMLQDVAAPPLSKRLRDGSVPVIAQAAWSLGKLKVQGCLPELQALESHPDWTVRWRAKGAVADLKRRSPGLTADG